MRLGIITALTLSAGTLLSAGALTAQMGNLTGNSEKPKSYVIYDAEPQIVPAGTRSVVEMRFRVIDGFHVNSHTPKSELLIPTKVDLKPAAGVKAETAEYPAGTTFSFAFNPKNKLDVYAGDFTVKLPVVARAGQHEIDGTLRYQACDHAACYPPRSLPIQVVFTAK
jgi:DsbC/DsbD-like thiol-disulfide interchange protein